MGDLRKTPLGKLLLLQALIGGGSPAVERIALGNPLTFGTDLARPLVSLEIPFTPQQEGTGDPSPSNIRSILPWNGLTVFGGGKNLVGAFVRGGFDDYGDKTSSGARICSDYIECVGGAKYTLNASGEKTLNCYIYSFDEKGQYRAGYSGRQTLPYTYETSENAKYIRIMFRFSDNSEIMPSDVSDIQLEAGETATAYEPYKPITETDIVFPSAVYGGTLDVVSGVLTVEWSMITDTGQNPNGWSSTEQSQSKRFVLNKGNFDYVPKNSGRIFVNYFKNASSGWWSAFIGSTGNFLCYVPLDEFPSKDSWIAYLAEHPLTIAYELAEPFEVQLTPEQITALVGDNTIWSDADGSMTCVYLVSSKYADEHPVGGLGFGFGSWTPAEPDDPENPDESEEPIIDDSENNQTEGEEP